MYLDVWGCWAQKAGLFPPPSDQPRLSVSKLVPQAQTRGQGWILQSRAMPLWVREQVEMTWGSWQ